MQKLFPNSLTTSPKPPEIEITTAEEKSEQILMMMRLELGLNLKKITSFNYIFCTKLQIKFLGVQDERMPDLCNQTPADQPSVSGIKTIL